MELILPRISLILSHFCLVLCYLDLKSFPGSNFSSASSVFGVPIEFTVRRQQSNTPVPNILIKCADHLILSGAVWKLKKLGSAIVSVSYISSEIIVTLS